MTCRGLNGILTMRSCGRREAVILLQWSIGSTNPEAIVEERGAQRAGGVLQLLQELSLFDQRRCGICTNSDFGIQTYDADTTSPRSTPPHTHGQTVLSTSRAFPSELLFRTTDSPFQGFESLVPSQDFIEENYGGWEGAFGYFLREDWTRRWASLSSELSLSNVFQAQDRLMTGKHAFLSFAPHFHPDQKQVNAYLQKHPNATEEEWCDQVEWYRRDGLRNDSTRPLNTSSK